MILLRTVCFHPPRNYQLVQSLVPLDQQMLNWGVLMHVALCSCGNTLVKQTSTKSGF
jgi:hypothetical protein